MQPLDTLLAQAESFSSSALESQVWERLIWLDRLELHSATKDIQDIDPVRASAHARAQRMRERLEAYNEALYRSVRDDIRTRRRSRRLLELLSSPGVISALRSIDDEGFDLLDEVVTGVLQLSAPDIPSVGLESEMVAYQPTPARHVLDLLRRAALTDQDVLFDLGSGLGHVPLLAALCASSRAVGIEIEPAYVRCASAAAQRLNVANARFLQQDVRHADLSDGTVFYLYTPFRGAILDEVLERIRHESRHRRIRIFSFGPCTLELLQVPWLRTEDAADANRMTLFLAG